MKRSYLRKKRHILSSEIALRQIFRPGGLDSESEQEKKNFHVGILADFEKDSENVKLLQIFAVQLLGNLC